MFHPFTQLKICNLDSQNIISKPTFDALSNGELFLSLQAIPHANIFSLDIEILTF
jgi:hypothetical protein